METVADAKNGFDIGGLAGSGFDFSAQVADMDVERAVQTGEAALELVYQLGRVNTCPGEGINTASRSTRSA